MGTKPPAPGPSGLLAFALLDELIRTLVDKGNVSPNEAAAMLERTIANIRSLNLAIGPEAVSVLNKMLHEYRKQTR